MQPTTLTLHPSFTIAPVDERIFGGFLEHMGRAVYEGVFDPKSPHADEHGLRRDVVQALAGLHMTAMRYPGGNFASGYHWRDGIGSRDRRPALRDLAWQSLEPNTFGTDEFMELCRQLPWQPMLTVNLGTGTPQEAGEWVDYCNGPLGTKWPDLRAANGHPEPYGVKLWCLGNEMDGPWQLGHVPADHYAIRAQQAAKIMKDVDPTIETVVCGTCGHGGPTYMEWDRKVLDHCGDFVDYISLHRYSGNHLQDSPSFLAEGLRVGQQIREMDSACKFVQARRQAKKRAFLCFDEWNIWYRAKDLNGRGKFAPHLIEEVYNVEDAMVVAGYLMAFIRHADAVKIANIAQVVNVIAPVLTRGDQMFRQTIYWPFEMLSRRREGVSLRPVVSGPQYEVTNVGQVDYVDAAAILGSAGLQVFLVNRSLEESAEVRVRLLDRALVKMLSGELLTGPDKNTANSFEEPDKVVPSPLTEIAFQNGEAIIKLPPLSLAAMTLEATA